MKKYTLVAGLGLTGKSCLKYLASQQDEFIVFDSRKDLDIEEIKSEYPNIEFYLGDFPQQLIPKLNRVVISPGLASDADIFCAARKQNIPIISDIELFVTDPRVKAKIIAVTGTNGKSTVVTLLGKITQAEGYKVAVIGNIGTPVLSLLEENTFDYDYLIIELSSFQLETTYSLNAAVATVLNISADHLDRHGSIEQYAEIKRRIYKGAETIVSNADDGLTQNIISTSAKTLNFSMDCSSNANYFFAANKQSICIKDKPDQDFVVSNFTLQSRPFIENSLAALAIADSLGFSLKNISKVISNFSGLPHRCQLVTKENNICWINDSKGTNIGACLSALQGVGEQVSGKVVLILGGDSKGGNFEVLIPTIKKYCRAVVIKGTDQKKILDTLQNHIKCLAVSNMVEAISQSALCARANDAVLLSPACSSLDEYRNFQERGMQFINGVNNLLNQKSAHVGEKK